LRARHSGAHPHHELAFGAGELFSAPDQRGHRRGAWAAVIGRIQGFPEAEGHRVAWRWRDPVSAGPLRCPLVARARLDAVSRPAQAPLLRYGALYRAGTGVVDQDRRGGSLPVWLGMPGCRLGRRSGYRSHHGSYPPAHRWLHVVEARGARDDLQRQRAQSVQAQSLESGRSIMAKVVLEMGSSSGPMLPTPPEEWGQRVVADKRNKEHHYKGKTWTYEQLVDARKGEGLQKQIELPVWRERHTACRKALGELAK